MKPYCGQLDLFAFEQKPRDLKTEHINDAKEKAPADIAIVWTATECGNNSDPHFFLSINDAKKFCSDQRSKGILHGTRWAFFWSSLKNYCGNYYDLTDGGLDLSKFFDNGSRDALLKELGIEKIPFAEVVQKLESSGIKVIEPHQKRLKELEQFKNDILRGTIVQWTEKI